MIKNIIQQLKIYKKEYKNYFIVLLKLYFKRRKSLQDIMTKVILRDGTVHTWTFLNVYQYPVFVSYIKKSNVVDCFDGKSEYLSFNYGDRKLIFYGAKNDGDIIHVFGFEDYKY